MLLFLLHVCALIAIFVIVHCYCCYCYFKVFFKLLLQLLLRPMLLFPCKSFSLYQLFHVITIIHIGVGLLFCVCFLHGNESFSHMDVIDVSPFAFFKKNIFSKIRLLPTEYTLRQKKKQTKKQQLSFMPALQ